MELKPMYAGINNSPKTTLISEISATTQSIEVADISVFPPAPNLATIGTGATAEVIRYNGISGATLTGCERGFDGTTPGVWRASEAIYRAFTKHDFETLQENITGLQAQLLELQGMIPAGLPSGGTPGQYLRKASEADYAAEWATVETRQVAYNLLDNSDFTNPVNQRGQGFYNKAAYTIDRWVNNYTRPYMTINDGYIAFENTDTTYGYRTNQRFAPGTLKIGQKYTVAVKTHSGEISAAVLVMPDTDMVYSGYVVDGCRLGLGKEEGADFFFINISSLYTVELDWVALYEGEYTTEPLPKYIPKGYGAELNECLRYFRVYSTSTIRPSKGGDCSPPMRIENVTQGTLEIGGETYFYNSADL